jgi:hypothetical protein
VFKVPPWEALVENLGNGYHLLQDVDGGPLGVLPVGLIVVTTKVVGDVDGGPLGGAAGGFDSGHHRICRRC